MNFNPIVLSIPIYFLLIGIELLIQAFSKKHLYRLNDAVTNISCGITQQVSGVFFKLLTITAYQWIYEHYSFMQIPATWWSLIILFMAADFLYYWAHRMSHEINLFWGGHVVHHQSEDYNFSVALRQGSFQVIWTFAFNLPLAFLGFDTLSFVLMSGLVTVYQFWIHTETIDKLGPIEWIFNTPSHHRVHHGRNPKYIDKNHAGVFIIWDRMFGTYQVEEERPTYGITKPINSWNPVWVNVQHYADMAATMKQIKGVKDKLRYMFNKPGWLPDYLGGMQPIPEVDNQNYRKYDAKVNLNLSYYILFQFVLILAGSALFLFNEAALSFSNKVLFAGLIVFTIVNCGVLFERKSWVQYAEILRLLIIMGLVVSYFMFSPQLMLAGTAVSLYTAICVYWMYISGVFSSPNKLSNG